MPTQDVRGPIVPDVATCVVCGTLANTSQLSCSAFPDGEYRWVCLDFHVCARNLATAVDLKANRPLHADLAPEHGSFASLRHLDLRRARLRELIKGDT